MLNIGDLRRAQLDFERGITLLSKETSGSEEAVQELRALQSGLDMCSTMQPDPSKMLRAVDPRSKVVLPLVDKESGKLVDIKLPRNFSWVIFRENLKVAGCSTPKKGEQILGLEELGIRLVITLTEEVLHVFRGAISESY